MIKKSGDLLINDSSVLVFLVKKPQFLPWVVQLLVGGKKCNECTQGELAIDCQMTTDLLLSFGAREIGGEEFQIQLQSSIKNITPSGYWNNDINN